MSKYAYPAIFVKEDTGYSINFPDLEGCYTCGNNIEDGIKMAEDALALMLYEYEIEKKEIPSPSNPEDITLEGEDMVNYIRCDTMEYRKRYANKAVKKTLTIPEWLNEEAMAIGVNFSQVLQEALIQKIQSK